MIGAVHACIGAGVGSFFRNKSAAFVSGVVSHLVADALPHKDLAPEIEVPLMAGMMAGIAAWKGLDSPEFWGAMGGISPDVEHGLLVAGIINKEQKVFPSHIRDGKWHGEESNERLSQLLLSIAGLVVVALNTEE